MHTCPLYKVPFFEFLKFKRIYVFRHQLYREINQKFNNHGECNKYNTIQISKWGILLVSMKHFKLSRNQILAYFYITLWKVNANFLDMNAFLRTKTAKDYF